MKAERIIMFPTVLQAIKSWNRICETYQSIIKVAKRNPLSITFINGYTWYFRGKSEGERAIRGYHADITFVDDFIFEDEIGEMLVED